MGVQGEILRGFFETLEQDQSVPDSLVEGLKHMSEQSTAISKDKILELIGRECGDVSEDQED